MRPFIPRPMTRVQKSVPSQTRKVRNYRPHLPLRENWGHVRLHISFAQGWGRMAEKILIVDDDIDSLKLIGLMLQRQGYEITAANAGAQALAKAAAETPELIILDVMMPDMDGYEVCRRLRADARTRGIPVIMFTAKTLVDDKVAGFE